MKVVQVQVRAVFSSARSFLFLTALMAITFITAVMANAQTYTIMHRFNGTDGEQPNFLLLGQDGVLYGTTFYGGDRNCDPPFGCGTVFKLDHSGLTTIHTYSGGSDGELPWGQLVQDSASNLYGTNNYTDRVWKLDSSGNQTIVYQFSLDQGTQAGPALVGGPGNALYGILLMKEGGGCGAVYKVNRNTGRITTLHSFIESDGCHPQSGLLRDPTGNLYGTTVFGGDLSCDQKSGCGVVYKLDTAGNLTVLHSFHGGSDGAYPTDVSVTMDSAGNLYGMTGVGGAGGGAGDCLGNGCGLVYKIDTEGNYSVVYSFSSKFSSDVATGGVLWSPNGYLYGVVGIDGADAEGMVFQIDSMGNFTDLHDFTAFSRDGFAPYAGLMRDGSGNLYGLTKFGGFHNCGQTYSSAGCGVIFKITF